MNETAVNGSLKCVGAADALNHTLSNEFACVLDFFDAGSECYIDAVLDDDTIEFKFEGSGFVHDAPSDLALAANYALDERAHGKDDFVVADEILSKDCMNGIAWFRCISRDGSGEANPERLTDREFTSGGNPRGTQDTEECQPAIQVKQDSHDDESPPHLHDNKRM